MDNPWTELPSSAPYVLPSDAARVGAFNNDPKVPDQRRLRLEIVPEPYIGRIDAPIVFLKLNPGYSPTDIRFTEDPRAREVWRKNILHQALDYPFYVLDPELAWADNANWWKSKIRQVLQIADDRTVANNVLCIEAFPYHSVSAPYFPGVLPSQRYNFALVNQAIDRGALILMANTVNWWHQQVPRLSGYANLFVARTQQGGQITPGYYPDGFPKLERILRASARLGR